MRGAGRLTLAALLLACTEAPRTEPPNLVVISLDTTRADHLGLYGYFRDTSPRLTFANCRSASVMGCRPVGSFGSK